MTVAAVARRPSRGAPAGAGAGSRSTPVLLSLLQQRFGHPGFRPHQQRICETVADGHDALVVMPTGAGKSLCYQLPGLARRVGQPGSCVVVVSPLIALMDDQANKLVAQGFNAARIHSGCDREASREACRQYLRGELDFLFFAPERLAVPGFPELLAKRTPALVAIDEAHCISHWGHDFRPEYRMLGERLPLLRPAPVIALTATATPTVQDDIVELLGLGTAGGHEAASDDDDDSGPQALRAHRFIHGFRRENLALEVVDCAPTQRRTLAAKAVADPAHRPAILYAPTRKDAEEIAAEFADEGLECAAYHAGLNPKIRENVQNAFLKGALDVVVATIAFGMGVDKPDVRTVVHLALPSSLESYSQEVGRAGRDGKPSRALLLGSMVDSKMHGFFLDRDYPDSKELGRVWRVLDNEDTEEAVVRKASGLDEDTFAKAIEKLWIHGGALGFGGVWRRGHDKWEKPYLAQKRHKEAQIAGMTRFLDEKSCRQLALLRHFGDVDNKGPCGICDGCDPKSCRLRQSRELTDEEDKLLKAIETRLRTVGSKGVSTGKLYAESLEPRGVDRRSFEHLLSALVRANRVVVEERVFNNDKGEKIRYMNATLASAATSSSAGTVSMFVSARDDSKKKPARKTRSAAAGSGAATKSKTTTTTYDDEDTSSGRRTWDGDERARAATPTRGKRVDGEWAAADAQLMNRLRAWRLAEAQKAKAPAFTVFSDRVLIALAKACPSSLEQLALVPGLSKRLVDKKGHELIELCQEAS